LNKLVPLIGVQFLAATLVVLNSIVPAAPLQPSQYFNPPYVYASFNAIFLLPAGASIAYISSKAFKSSGLIGLQVMGAGALALSISTLSTWAGVTDQAIAFYYIVLNLFGILCGALFQGIGVLLTFRSSTIKPEARTRATVVTYLVVAILGLIILDGAAQGWIPPFFNASTQTSLSLAVLTAAALFYAFSSIVLGWTYLSTRSDIVYWYLVAMLLITMSVVTYLFIRHPGDPISWLYRGTTFLYGGAFVVAVLKSREPSR
jgi:hypothetical protein